MLRVFPMSLTGAEVILFYNGLDVLTRQILVSKCAIPTKIAADAKITIQEMAKYSQKWQNRTSSKAISTETSYELTAIQAQLNNLGREIKKVNEKVYAAQVGYELCKGPHYTKDCLLKEEEKTLEEAYYTHFGSPYQPGGQYRAARGLPGSTEPNPKSHVKLILTAKADSSEIRHMRCSSYVVSGSQHKNIFFETVPFPSQLQNYYCDDWRKAQDVKILEAYDHTLPQKEKDPGSFTLPCFIHDICFDKALVDLGENVSVMPFSTYSNLGLDNGDHERKNQARTLIDIPIFVGNFSIISGFLIDDVDITSGTIRCILGFGIRRIDLLYSVFNCFPALYPLGEASDSTQMVLDNSNLELDVEKNAHKRAKRKTTALNEKHQPRRNLKPKGENKNQSGRNSLILYQKKMKKETKGYGIVYRGIAADGTQVAVKNFLLGLTSGLHIYLLLL
nr:hypothetical protein [Tanacetum cinerariifolium]